MPSGFAAIIMALAFLIGLVGNEYAAIGVGILAVLVEILVTLAVAPRDEL